MVEVAARLDEPACKGVPKIVPPEIDDLCAPTGSRKTFLEVSKPGPVRASEQLLRPLGAVFVGQNCPDCRQGNGTQRDAARCSAFGMIQDDLMPLQVYPRHNQPE